MENIPIYISCQEAQDILTINEYIEVEGFDGLVEVHQTASVPDETPVTLYINESGMYIKPDWLDQRPALIFPEKIPFTKKNFSGTLYGLLNIEIRYSRRLKSFPELLHLFDLSQKIITGTEADSTLDSILNKANRTPFDNYAINHNAAIGLNYGNCRRTVDHEVIESYYKKALQSAVDPEYKAYTLKYYASFLLDSDLTSQAIESLNLHTPESLTAYPKFSLERIRCQALMMQLALPDSASLLTELKERLWETVQFFDKKGHKIIAGLLWTDAAFVATRCKSYTESLGYINKAMAYFQSEGQEELAAQANLVSGRLYFDWAQSGNPQFYKSALESYQEALKVFKRDEAPQVFADIHHHLGVIYAELPDESKKKSLWAAISTASFTEALNHYNKEERPYGYGSVCNSFANACSKFSNGEKSDHLEKALWLYNEALSVRPASTHPVERAVTLLNYLEISWKVGNPEGPFNSDRYNDMLQKANEIKTLARDAQLLQEADKHIKLLKEMSFEL